MFRMERRKQNSSSAGRICIHTNTEDADLREEFFPQLRADLQVVLIHYRLHLWFQHRACHPLEMTPLCVH